MANINILSSTLTVVIVTAAIIFSMAGDGEAGSWPPQCAGFTKKVINPCRKYVTAANATSEVPTECCDGLKEFTKDAKTTTAKRRAGCYCVKQSAMNPEYKKGRVQKVAVTCGYKLPDPTLDCKTVP